MIQLFPPTRTQNQYSPLPVVNRISGYKQQCLLVITPDTQKPNKINELKRTAGQLVLSPTRTYAPIIAEVLKEYRHRIHGMIHCSGGAQTKILNFVDDLHIVKNNLFDVPPVFKIIHRENIRMQFPNQSVQDIQSMVCFS